MQKWLSEEALQIAVKRSEMKSKGEKEGNTHLNAEFQRITRRDKKAFLGDQCKEIEENMGASLREVRAPAWVSSDVKDFQGWRRSQLKAFLPQLSLGGQLGGFP